MTYPYFNTLVDVGGNHYETVRRSLNRYPRSFQGIYVFEPNPHFHESYIGSVIELVPKAAWIHDGKMPFYISTDERQMCSSFYTEGFPVCDTPIEVECVDLGSWLINHINPFVHLTLKLDIEGSEYEVLRKMIKNNTIKLVNELYVEFHDHRMTHPDHAAIIADLIALGLPPLPWD
jgi:FkbM family methyltransferase